MSVDFKPMPLFRQGLSYDEIRTAVKGNLCCTTWRLLSNIIKDEYPEYWRRLVDEGLLDPGEVQQ